MREDKGNSNLLVALVISISLLIAGYFGYNYFKKSQNQEVPKTIKKEMGNSKPLINKKDNYLELVDNNSNKTISIKIPTTTTIDTSYGYGISVKPDTKKITQSDKYEFDDNFIGDGIVYYFEYSPKLIVPQFENAQFGGCMEYRIGIQAFNKSYNSILEEYRNMISDLAKELNDNFKLNEKEFTLNKFQANTMDNMPDAGNGHLETLIKIDENYTLNISSSCHGTTKNGNNDNYLDLYYEVLNSISEK